MLFVPELLNFKILTAHSDENNTKHMRLKRVYVC